MKILVTQNNIDNGVPKSSCECPIARALRGIFPGEEIEVRRKKAYVGKATSYFMPLEACQFIDRFDKGYKVDPFEFEL